MADESFICEICNKKLSRKQRLITHQRSKHGLHAEVPVQSYKRYKTDPSIPVPRTTLYRHRKQQKQEEECDPVTDPGCQNEDIDVSQEVNFETLSDNSDSQQPIQNTEMECSFTELCEFSDKDQGSCIETPSTSVLSNNEIPEENIYSLNLEQLETNRTETVGHELGFSSDSSDSDSSEEGSVKNENASVTLTEEEEIYMSVMAYSSRHCLNGEAVSDMLKLVGILTKKTPKEYSRNKMNERLNLDFRQKIFDICSECNTLFPEDESQVNCEIKDCKGLRFKGTLAQQHRRRRKSYFATADVQNQIQSILERQGAWEALMEYRKNCQPSENINDILNGEHYKTLFENETHLSSENSFSMIFNTDGIPLYSSSKVNIWPVYLIINEFPPKMRFSRQNMILWGIWQSKGKPYFPSFFQPFVEDMIRLKEKGITITLSGEERRVKGVLLAGTLDLQAKAMLLDMMHHNGINACITCEMPGIVVQQGRGYARVFPYLDNEANLRNSEDVLQCGAEAAERRKTNTRDFHSKGMKGISPLFGMAWFDVVKGIVPDYMHGALLGVTKQMLGLFFSPKNSNKPYFLGKQVKEIDAVLTAMKPTDDIPRLPRALEQHYHQLKAAELQTWLLYYAIPCLMDFLPKRYMDHLALMVEGLYILLGESIENNQLQRAADMLKMFYKEFENLYGLNNVTINLHNTGMHLAYYVKNLGPVWAWSCFPFEDMNGSLLDHLHGTGNVCSQILGVMHTQKQLAIDVNNISNSHLKGFTKQMIHKLRQTKVKKQTRNCDIAGGMKAFIPDEEMKNKLQELLDCDNLGNLFKICRIVLDDQVIYSITYSRVEKRNSYTVSVAVEGSQNKKVGVIKYFLYHENSDKCVAVVTYIEESGLLHPEVKHIKQVNTVNEQMEEVPVHVEQICDKLLYLSGNERFHCIARIPNRYGQCS